MSEECEKYSWKDVKLEELNPLISRKMVWADDVMISQVFLKKDAIVPAHHHHNQQVTYILEGCLRFWLGADADNPGDVYTDIHAGEVLMIPRNVRHRALALEDTLDLDVFNPPRQDWIDGSDAYIRGKK